MHAQSIQVTCLLNLICNKNYDWLQYLINFDLSKCCVVTIITGTNLANFSEFVINAKLSTR